LLYVFHSNVTELHVKTYFLFKKYKNILIKFVKTLFNGGVLCNASVSGKIFDYHRLRAQRFKMKNCKSMRITLGITYYIARGWFSAGVSDKS
jgi:hypothetical protein